MRVLVQKALDASVTVEGQLLGRIDSGYLLLVGFTPSDTEADVVYLAKKVAGLRVNPDEQGKMNRNLREAGGSVLSVSQFTLYGDATEGNRPSFTKAADGKTAEPLFDRFNRELAATHGIAVQTGRFGAHMEVRFTNDGPVTLLLESKKNAG